MAERIKMATPLVEMDGDEMTRILWAEIKEKLEGVSLQEPEIYLFLCDYYREQQESILGGL